MGRVRKRAAADTSLLEDDRYLVERDPHVDHHEVVHQAGAAGYSAL